MPMPRTICERGGWPVGVHVRPPSRLRSGGKYCSEPAISDCGLAGSAARLQTGQALTCDQVSPLSPERRICWPVAMSSTESDTRCSAVIDQKPFGVVSSQVAPPSVLRPSQDPDFPDDAVRVRAVDDQFRQAVDRRGADGPGRPAIRAARELLGGRVIHRSAVRAAHAHAPRAEKGRCHPGEGVAAVFGPVDAAAHRCPRRRSRHRRDARRWGRPRFHSPVLRNGSRRSTCVRHWSTGRNCE